MSNPCVYGAHDCAKNWMGLCVHHQRDALQKTVGELRDIQWAKDARHASLIDIIIDDMKLAVALIKDKEYRDAIFVLEDCYSSLRSE